MISEREFTQSSTRLATNILGCMAMKKIEKKSLKTLLPIISFLKPYKKMVFFALLALLITAAVSLSLGQGIKLVIDQGLVADSVEQLKSAIGIMIALIVLLAIGTFCRFYLMSWLGERVSADIRKAVFNRLITLHPSYFEENRSGEIMSRLTTDTTLLQSIVGSSFSMALRSSLTFVGGLIMLLITNVKLTLIILMGVPLAILPMLIFGKKVRSLSKASQDTIADVGTYAGEIIQNIKVVQSYTREKEERSAFESEVETAFAVAKKRIKQRSVLIASVILLVFGGLSGMLWVGGVGVITGAISAGELAAFVFYAMMVGMSLATISEVYGEVQRAAGAAERIVELMSLETNIVNPVKSQQMDDKEKLVEFDNVSFSYPSRPEQKALNNISFTINKGEVVALVGPSGAGKTTIFELLQRFYDPQQGSVKYKGVSLEQLHLNTFRQQMGMVPQNPVLFSSDVWHNIRYGFPEATKQQVEEAAIKAHAHDFIINLPEGYASYLGEQGVRLSGGQKQRLALARAIVKDPELLLLDEATSALDAESEAHVQEALNHLMKDRTTIIIAHRLSTVRHADKIIVVDNGQLVEQGTHQELYASSKLYQRLCKLQFEQAD